MHPKITVLDKDPQKGTKYRSKKAMVDGIVFDSIIEAEYYLVLDELKKNGLIKDFECQPVFELQPFFKKYGKKHQKIVLKADFKITYIQGSIQVIDIKGFPTETAKLKKKMFDYKYPDISLLWITYSKIDGGWIEYEDLKKARKERKKQRRK